MAGFTFIGDPPHWTVKNDNTVQSYALTSGASLTITGLFTFTVTGLPENGFSIVSGAPYSPGDKLIEYYGTLKGVTGKLKVDAVITGHPNTAEVRNKSFFINITEPDPELGYYLDQIPNIPIPDF